MLTKLIIKYPYRVYQKMYPGLGTNIDLIKAGISEWV